MPESPPDRRHFLTRVGLTGFFVSLALTLYGALQFLFPKAFYEPRTRFRLGRTDDFPPGTVRFIEDRRVFVFHDSQGLYAISAVCTHLGCVTAKSEDGFFCPCHGSRFGPKGRLISGPAPRGLPWLAVSLSASGYLVCDSEKSVEPGTKLPIA